MFKTQRVVLLFSLVVVNAVTVAQRAGTEKLADALYSFPHVQDSARPKVWWFHGETETTREGITADLEAFKKAGVGGVVYYDQSHEKAENALPGFSPDWWKMLRFSAEGKRYLEFGLEAALREVPRPGQPKGMITSTSEREPATFLSP